MEERWRRCFADGQVFTFELYDDDIDGLEAWAMQFVVEMFVDMIVVGTISVVLGIRVSVWRRSV